MEIRINTHLDIYFDSLKVMTPKIHPKKILKKDNVKLLQNRFRTLTCLIILPPTLSLYSILTIPLTALLCEPPVFSPH